MPIIRGGPTGTVGLTTAAARHNAPPPPDPRVGGTLIGQGVTDPPLRVELYQGTTLITSRSLTPGASLATSRLTLTTPEKALITDWTDLTVRLIATTASGKIQVTSVYLEVPNAPVAQARTPSPAVGTWVAKDAAVTGALSVSPSPAIAVWTAVSPTFLGGGTPEVGNPAPAIATWVAKDPAVALNNTVTPAPAIATWTALGPTITSAVSVFPAPAISTWVAKDAAIRASLTVELYQGLTLITSWVLNPTSTLTTSRQALTVPERASITDWADLHLVLKANGGVGHIRVTDAYLEVPNVIVATVQTRTPAPAISTWTAINPSTTSGGITVTPSPAISDWEVNDPTVTISPVILVSLWQADVLIADWEVMPMAAARTERLVVTPAEAALVTDWGNLTVELSAYASEGKARVTSLYLELPNRAPNVIGIPLAASQSWVAKAPAVTVGGQTASPLPAVGQWVALDATAVAQTTDATVTPAPAIQTWVAKDATIVSAVGGAPPPAIASWFVPAPLTTGGGFDPYAWFPSDPFRPDAPKPPVEEKRVRYKGPRRIPRAKLEQRLPTSYPPPELPQPAVLPPISPTPVTAVAEMVGTEPAEYLGKPISPEEEEEELLVVLLALHGS